MMILHGFFCLLDGVDMLTDVAHEQKGFVLRQQRGISNIIEGNRKFKSARGLVPERAVEVTNEYNRLVVSHHIFDGSRWKGMRCTHGALL
jgi:hypothetical protein